MHPDENQLTPPEPSPPWRGLVARVRAARVELEAARIGLDTWSAFLAAMADVELDGKRALIADLVGDADRTYAVSLAWRRREHKARIDADFLRLYSVPGLRRWVSQLSRYVRPFRL